MKLILLFKKITHFFFIHDIQSLFKKNTNVNIKLNDVIKYNHEREFGYKPYLCYAPSIAMYFNVYGDVLACCQNTKDKLGNVNKNTLNEIWNSTNRLKLQEQINNYSIPEGCKSCHNSINSSQPYQTLARIYDMPTMFYANNIKYPLDLTFEVSNTCNLECIMCNAEYSSTIRKNRDKLPDLPNYYPPDFFEQLKPYLVHGRIFRFQGGEPFLINLYLDIIEYICNNNNNYKIYIQTNGTIYNNRVGKILAYKNIFLSVSIDSLEEAVYKTIRKNANLSKVLQNIEYYSIHLVRRKNKLNINVCIMRNNWNEIPNFFKFCYKNNYTMTFIMVEYPEIYSIIYLEPNEIIKIRTFIELEILDIHKKKYSGIYNSIISTLNRFHNSSISYKYFIKTYTEATTDHIIEEIRNNLIHSFSEFAINEIINYSRSKYDIYTIDKYKLLLIKLLFIIKNSNYFEESIPNKDIRLINEFKRYIDAEKQNIN